MRELILASRSPRRRQLLEMLGIPVQVRPADIHETTRPNETPTEYAERLAVEKAGAVPGEYVLGADTIVVLEGDVLEKPADAEEAVAMLLRLQGRTHQVITACALHSPTGLHTATDVTRVTFRPAGEDLIRAYVATGEPLDKAGAYGIQGYGAALVEGIEGDFFGVMGLPVRRVLDLLEQGGWRYVFNR
ncbi:MAG: septum formation inhibitor Maf [Gemmatimonadetes bacterium]|nr:Maf family protein [Gemmatimonadota bacterium]TDJ57096.1 MAG: septum formation inhibitor Maf [Gemmatimonadota bacterium]